MNNVKKMLIVDDEETLTYSLYQSFIISQQDYEVVTAATGEEATEKLSDISFDLVITDIKMPGMDGLELLTLIKSRYPATEVIVMTAYGSQEKKEEALQKGARFYIEKPFEIREIKQLVMELLQ
jgi:YesN/AraC family two-component response regulator